MNDEVRKEYSTPKLVDLGTLAEETKAGDGTTLDGAPEPPQAFTPS